MAPSHPRRGGRRWQAALPRRLAPPACLLALVLALSAPTAAGRGPPGGAEEEAEDDAGAAAARAGRPQPSPEDLASLPLAPGEPPWKVLVEGGPAKLPTPLETLARSVTATALRAQAAASAGAATSGEVFARRDAEDTEVAAAGAQDAAEGTQRANKQLTDFLSREARAEAGAVSQARAAEAAYKHAQAFLDNMDQNVGSMVAGAGLEAKFAPIYKGLQEWKMKVLHDPVKAGRVAGVKAALPYEKALLKIEQKVGEDQQKATGMSNQARTLRTTASDLANKAVREQAVGKVFDAQHDMMDAHHMMSQAKAIEIEGWKTHDRAKAENDKIPLYVVAARQAAQEAVYRYVPEKFAPPPLYMGAFLRPPPTDV